MQTTVSHHLASWSASVYLVPVFLHASFSPLWERLQSVVSQRLQPWRFDTLELPSTSGFESPYLRDLAPAIPRISHLFQP